MRGYRAAVSLCPPLSQPDGLVCPTLDSAERGGGRTRVARPRSHPRPPPPGTVARRRRLPPPQALPSRMRAHFCFTAADADAWMTGVGDGRVKKEDMPLRRRCMCFGLSEQRVQRCRCVCRMAVVHASYICGDEEGKVHSSLVGRRSGMNGSVSRVGSTALEPSRACLLVGARCWKAVVEWWDEK